MIFRTIDGANDWTFGHGKGDYATAGDAIALNIRTRLYSFLNDCFFAMGFGIDWWNLLGGKNPQARIGIVLQCRTMIAGATGVIRINSVEARVSAERKLTVTYSVDTIYTRNLQGSVTL